MRRGRFEIVAGYPLPGQFRFRVSGQTLVVVDAVELDDIATMIESLSCRPAPQPTVPPEYMAMIESNLARVDTTLAKLGEQIDAVNEKCVERIDRQVNAKHWNLDFRLDNLEYRVTRLSKVEAALGELEKERVANKPDSSGLDPNAFATRQTSSALAQIEDEK